MRYNVVQLAGLSGPGNYRLRTLFKDAGVDIAYISINAIAVANAFERLGPVAIKMGQLLSTRADIFGAVFTQDLSHLKDRLAPFPTDQARQAVEASLGRSIDSAAQDVQAAIKAVLTQYCDQNGISMGKIGPVLRAVLTGGAPSPDIALVLALLGRNEAFARVRDYARAGG